MLTSDLRVFQAVASAGSLSAAARQLDVQPMQVSRRVAALEEELGTRLFHRTTRSVSLTSEGQLLLPYATTIIDAEDIAKSELGPASAKATGVLRMTAPSVFGQSIVVPMLSRLLEAHPDLSVDLDLSDKMVDIVGQGLDLALRLAPLGDSELIAKRIISNPRVICASPDYLRRMGRPTKLADLDSHYCIQLQAIPRWPFIIDGELTRKRVDGRVNTSSVDAVRTAAIQGLGLAMLTSWDIIRQVRDGRLEVVELQDAEMEELSVWAVTPSRRFTPMRVKVFLGALEDELDMISKSG
ncbi:LysR family transcriptional regulator [Pseudomonas sp. CDFA 602]|uniref:LysR family transcriptional regulator n=1 Tax=Pseudomonas californiensis TaxID=2829823 RepID=UPI001E2AD657|nr:LysR family transcriptional regulator [Pseudomonas californiensis]MCD5996384.1 LysR family transcriptional regulator [Pseudomonas californiensis]MCD6001983.1 LysR family transcriptional regulator [Pseudomonas californiensis]